MRSIASRMSVMTGEGALSVFAHAKELEAQGRSIIHLELGELLEDREQVEVVSAPVVAARGRRRILVMDDEPSVRALAGNMLQFLGYDAEVVENGTAAVERFGAALRDGDPFEAVMLDRPPFGKVNCSL